MRQGARRPDPNVGMMAVGYVLISLPTSSIPHYTIFIKKEKESTLYTYSSRDIGMTELSRCIVFFKAVKDHHFWVCLADSPCLWSAPKIPRRATRIAQPREASSSELPGIANERYPEAAGGNGGYIEVNLHKEGPRSGHLSRDRCPRHRTSLQ